MSRTYLTLQRALAAMLIAIGVAMVVSALAAGGGPGAVGVVVGALFAVVGTARLWLALRGPAR